MDKLTVGFAVTGSFCSYRNIFAPLETLCGQYNVIPIFSEIVSTVSTRFGTAEDYCQTVTKICGRQPLCSIREVEPIGPKKLLDLLIVAPCTGNTLSKLANGITDSAVTMACKAQLRNDRPVLLAISTNDGLSGSAKNLGLLLERKNVFFVPFYQDGPASKPTSLAAELMLLPRAAEAALEGRQLQPLLREKSL